MNKLLPSSLLTSYLEYLMLYKDDNNESSELRQLNAWFYKK